MLKKILFIVVILAIAMIAIGVTLDINSNKELSKGQDSTDLTKEPDNYFLSMPSFGYEFLSLNFADNNTFILKVKNDSSTELQSQDVIITFYDESYNLIGQVFVTLPPFLKDEVKDLSYDYEGSIIPKKFRVAIEKFSDPVLMG